MTTFQLDLDGDSSDKRIKGDTDGTLIGNVGDRLKVDAAITVPDNAPFTLPEYEDILYRLRVTEPRQLFQGQWGINGQPLVWSQLLTAGTFFDDPSVTGHNFVNLRTDTQSGRKIILQTQRYFRYQPHRAHSLTFAASFGVPTAGVRKRAGQFDDDATDGSNGFYIEMDGINGITFVVASTASGSQTYVRIPRTLWNVDKLDGTGPSQLNISTAELGNSAVWNIDYSWYGASIVQYNVVVGGKRVVLHEEVFTFKNFDYPFTKTAFLPLRFELETTSAIASPSIFTIGSISYDIENGEPGEFGYQWSAANGTAGVSVTGTNPTYILGVRPRLIVNGIKNRGVIVPNNVRILSSDDVFLEVLVGGNATGGTWTNVDTSRSVSEYSSNFTGYVGGRVVYSDYIAAGGGRATGALATSFPGDLFAAIDSLLGIQQTFAIRATKIVGNSTVYGSLSFKEVY